MGRKLRLGYVAQAADLTRLRAEFEWVRAVYVSCQQQALCDLDCAFGNMLRSPPAHQDQSGFSRPERSMADNRRPSLPTSEPS